MESNHVRDLMEAYSSIYAENEEVEQLDEFAPRLQGPVDRFLQGGQKVLKGLGLKVDEKERPTPDQNAQKAKINQNQNQSFDLFDIIKGHLLDEGFADTEEAALAIMTNMSEEWREQILDERTRGEQGMSDSEVSRRRNLGGNTRFNVSSGALGDHGSQGAIQKFHKRKSGRRQAIHKSGRNTRGDTGESGGKGRYEANKDHTDGYPSITKRGQGPG